MNINNYRQPPVSAQQVGFSMVQSSLIKSDEKPQIAWLVLSPLPPPFFSRLSLSLYCFQFGEIVLENV